MPWFDGGHMIWMAIWWIGGIALIVGLFWVLASMGRGTTPFRESPEEILRRRYAAGEIETEEYERRLGELRKTKSAA